MMWHTIRIVSGGATLVAFLAAVSVVFYRLRAQREKELIHSADEKDRARLVEHVLETFVIDTGSLTREQKHDLAIRQLDARMQRYRIAATVVVMLALVLAGLSVYAL